MTFIITRSGQKFDLANPTAAMVHPADIAHSLSMQCRFNGHTIDFYSVAQHCCLVADLVPEEHQLAALLHDATEAYVGDMVRPLKEGMRNHAHAIGEVCIYALTEERVWQAICQRFDLNHVLPASVKHADLVALATEKRDLMPAHPEPWACLDGITPAPDQIHSWAPATAAIHYQARLLQLLATTHRARASA
ncbi:MAG: phosphohydrolase [Gammaproteobacteria bacterium]|uniref:Phosphohydrolase n=1 Tax=viral metagenome TaxID=1070528 RepID=A0A6M3J6E4_9ZZZZ|nr:phosphohydrolase [Gammaproteobacteria bacterium]MBU2067505.1 phosphohydrolase [Gammaproteobacteria bacterium]MBU2139515.1 phosphohydrolase [Gammaproteobacteria bacterium]MBU2255943.1 phosphohydrolase [Gammaproteobacteria bacterium]MBU2295588.1 phosphohydrolase [Gammaproteobacteria bacterium]